MTYFFLHKFEKGQMGRPHKLHLIPLTPEQAAHAAFLKNEIRQKTGNVKARLNGTLKTMVDNVAQNKEPTIIERDNARIFLDDLWVNDQRKLREINVTEKIDLIKKHKQAGR